MFGRKDQFDPIKFGYFDKGTPLSHKGRVDAYCEDCEAKTPHDDYEAILGVHAGFAFPFGRKSTSGKLGKRSNWRFCSHCGAMIPLDEAAEAEALKAIKKYRGA